MTGSRGFVIGEAGHVVNILPPIDLNGGVVNSDVFSMRNYNHASIIISQGVIAGASTVTLEECDDFVPTNTTAIAFAAYKEETADGDTLGPRVAVPATGLVMTTNNNTFYVIEVDGQELSDGRPALRLVFSDPAAGAIVGAVAVLSRARFGEVESQTEIA